MICLTTALFIRWYFEDDNTDDEETHTSRFAEKSKGVLEWKLSIVSVFIYEIKGLPLQLIMYPSTIQSMDLRIRRLFRSNSNLKIERNYSTSRYAKVSSSKNSPGFTDSIDSPPLYISRSSTGSVRRRKSLQPSLPENLETSQSRKL